MRNRRKELGLSQRQLAQRAGVSHRSVQFAEAAKAGMQRRTLASIAEALNLGFDEIVETQPQLYDRQDALSEGPWNVYRFFQKKLTPNPLSYCVDADDARGVIAIMRDSWRAHLMRATGHASSFTFTEADRLLNERYSNYHRRYLEIWKKNPGTIRFSVDGETRTGASVVLPVTDEAYNKLLLGEVDYLQITADDILPCSQNLIIDSAVEFAKNRDLPWYRVTESLTVTVFSQLSRLAIDPTVGDFRMLSFGASQQNIRRLKSNGFTPNGQRMPSFDFSIFQFGGETHSMPVEQYERSSTVSHVLHLLKRRGLESSRVRQRVFTCALKAYQVAAGADGESQREASQTNRRPLESEPNFGADGRSL